jgi:hypothetical protein
MQTNPNPTPGEVGDLAWLSPDVRATAEWVTNEVKFQARQVIARMIHEIAQRKEVLGNDEYGSW